MEPQYVLLLLNNMHNKPKNRAYKFFLGVGGKHPLAIQQLEMYVGCRQNKDISFKHSLWCYILQKEVARKYL